VAIESPTPEPKLPKRQAQEVVKEAKVISEKVTTEFKEKLQRPRRARPAKRVALPPAHPECKRCAALNYRAAERMRKIRSSE